MMEYARSVQPVSTPPRLLARDVERMLLRRIAEGDYGVGERLPSCERLGRQIGANKNTVSKAYRALAANGYVTATAGRGTFVTALPTAGAATGFASEVGSLLGLVVDRAYAAGVGLDELERVVGEEIRRRYYRSDVRVAYVECNLREARRFSGHLSEVLSMPVEPLLLDDLLADPEPVAAAFAVIAVDLSHLAALQRRLAAWDGGEIVPVLTLPDPEALAEVAGLDPGARLAIVTQTREALAALAGLVQAVNPGLTVQMAIAGEPEQLREAIRSSDVLLVTEAAHEHVGDELAGKPLIDAPFKLDARSVETLAQRVAVARRDRASAPSA
jgi:DNA-binding transcriptional regulator YhcF (GntR family)